MALSVKNMKGGSYYPNNIDGLEKLSVSEEINIFIVIFIITTSKPLLVLSGNIYLFKVNSRNTRKNFEICSNLSVKASEWRRSGVFIVNFEHISHLFLVFLLLTLNK